MHVRFGTSLSSVNDDGLKYLVYNVANQWHAINMNQINIIRNWKASTMHVLNYLP